MTAANNEPIVSVIYNVIIIWQIFHGNQIGHGFSVEFKFNLNILVSSIL